MKTRISTKTNGVDIELSEIDVDRERLLDAFAQCQQGRCGCPTDEYNKMDRVEIAADDDGIRIAVDARTGETLELGELEKCLAWTTDSVRSDD